MGISSFSPKSSEAVKVLFDIQNGKALHLLGVLKGLPSIEIRLIESSFVPQNVNQLI